LTARVIRYVLRGKRYASDRESFYNRVKEGLVYQESRKKRKETQDDQGKEIVSTILSDRNVRIVDRRVRGKVNQTTKIEKTADTIS
jgi:hypothetical protein